MATPIPANDATFSLAEVLLATRAELSRGGLANTVRGVTTDSRAVRPGELFVALRGERFDGHDHLAAAQERGACAALVEQVPEGLALPCLRVDDTQRALGALAAAHRQRVGAFAPGKRLRVVGITGSAGKTTTRHVVVELLSQLGYSVHSSAGNLNNQIGVPMTLLGLTAAHQVLVVEMGMNQPGEIAYLAELTQPDIGVVTLVADAHTEGVGSLGGVALEKAELLRALPETGTALANADSEGAVAGLFVSSARRRWGYGSAAGSDVRLVSRTPLGTRGAQLVVALPGSGRLSVEVSLLGNAGALAVLAAVGVVVAIDPSIVNRVDELQEAVRQISPGEGGRLAVARSASDVWVIDDAYNANPASMISSLDAASEIAMSEQRPLVLLLGAMRELGAGSAELHRSVGIHVGRIAPEFVVVVDDEAEPLAAYAAAAGVRVLRAKDAAQAASLLAAEPLAGRILLAKASNSLGLSWVAGEIAGA